MRSIETTPLLPQSIPSLAVTSDRGGLPLRFINLSVFDNVESDQLVVTLGSSLLDLVTLGTLRRALKGKDREKEKRSEEETYAVKGIDGIVNQGETLLILGPPTSNAAVLLRALSSPSDLQLSPSSHLDYGLIPIDRVVQPPPFSSDLDAGRLRSEVVFLSEHDVHFAALSVEDSFLPASLAKTPRSTPSPQQWAKTQMESLLASVGLSHTLKTKVGSASVQGLSGGERKRASLLESLLTRASVLLLESPIAGLDSSSALALLSFLRSWTKSGRRSLVASTPHIADNLYHIFDKVLVLDSHGRQVYFGSTNEAEKYFESLNFVRRAAEGEGIAEFIVNCAGSGPNEVKLETAWKLSRERANLMVEMDSYVIKYADRAAAFSDTTRYTVSFFSQFIILSRRQLNLIISELPTYVTKTLVNILLSLLVGTVFFHLPPTTEHAYTRGGLLLLSIMFNGYLALAELGKAIEGRDIVKRQSDYGFFSSSALALARVVGDLPLIGVQVLLFGTMTYVLAGLQRSMEKFLIYLLFVYIMALNLSSMFRLFAALSPSFDVAIRYCGLSLNILVVYAGYFIPTPSMVNSLKFIHYILDPISYAFESVLANEFHNLDLSCSANHIVPSGSGYNDTRYQTCSFPGSSPGSLSVLGDDYLSTAYDFHHSKLWSNLFVLILQALVFLVGSIIATELLEFTKEGTRRVWIRRNVEEKFIETDSVHSTVDVTTNAGSVDGSALVFESLSVWVDTPLDTRKLLDGIHGFVEPGTLVSLLGPSGAGKSTLLNALAGRNGDGVVRGRILIDGQTPQDEFYRTTGYVQQFDHHDDRSTVREALEFSALLRQDARIPRSEKLAYVDTVLELMDLTHLSDAIIGIPSAGISSEQRKRLTIAVEVVARPTLLFCDEPTTNLDSKSALRVIQLLHRLSRTGMAVITTIHQPSVEVFNLFDNVLLLETGGRQIYFGPRQSAVSYFTTGIRDESTSPADILLKLASSPIDDTLSTTWKSSPEFASLRSRCDQLSRPSSSLRSSFVSVSTLQQSIELTKRVSRHFYRDPSFTYTKFFTALAVSLIIGFSFFQLGSQHTIVSLQNRLFSIFLILFIPPVFMNLIIFKMHRLRNLFNDREGTSLIYGRTAFVTSLLLSEIPYSLVCATLYFSCWYLLVGFSLSNFVYSFASVQLFFVFQATWAMWITALAPSLGTISNLLPFFLVSAEIFNGALMPYSLMPYYWKWLYWISPFQWYVRGLLGTLLHDLPVVCTSSELVSFVPPPNSTCGSYAAEYLVTNAGYLIDAASTDLCSFCRFSTGDDYLKTLNIQYSDRYWSLLIFAAYSLSNVALVYLFTFYSPSTVLKGRKKKRAEIAADQEEERDRLQGETLLEGRGGL